MTRLPRVEYSAGARPLPIWIRVVCVKLHRWAGLAMAAYLILVAVTGSLLAFRPELERLTRPESYPTASGAKVLEPAALIGLAQAAVPEVEIRGIVMENTQGATVVRVRTKPDSSSPRFDRIYVDPYTGAVLGWTQLGDLSEGIGNLIPFIYEFHYSFALGDFGGWMLGFVALAWTLDCFVGLYLTFPMSGKAWFQRWRHAWKIRRPASRATLNTGLHRVGSLCLWVMLLVFAWSSVAFNLPSVYEPVMGAFFHMPPENPQATSVPRNGSMLSWAQAETRGKALMEELGSRHGFAVKKPILLFLDRKAGVYTWRVRSTLDIIDRGGETSIRFDAYTGALTSIDLPRRQYSGQTAKTWLSALHTANVFGLSYRIFVCLLGLSIVMLSVTGVVIWMRKRRTLARVSRASHALEGRLSWRGLIRQVSSKLW